MSEANDIRCPDLAAVSVQGWQYFVVWTKSEFLTFAKPYFVKGKAWDFKPYNRNVYLNNSNDIAWFNEQLDTWMGVCRGSGVLQKKNGGWKIYQYTLSVAVPNEKIKEVVSLIEQN